MSGSFASLNTALSALRYNRAAMDTASQNIANVGVEGYTRRRVEAASAGTPTTPAMWSRNQDPGHGVTISGITRMNDAFLDARARAEHGKQSFLDVRQVVLDRLDSGIGEPGENGLAAIMGELRQAWSDLANNPTSAAARSQVLARGQAVSAALGLQARNFTVEAADQRVRLNVMVDEVNSLATDLAATNKAVAATTLDGSDAGNLLDQRDLLVLRLAELTGGKATGNGAGGFDFSVNGVPLVTGSHAGRLEVATGVTPSGDPDGNPVSFQVVHPINGTTAVPPGVGGKAGAVVELLDTTIPAYLTGLDTVARTLADGVNEVHRAGYDPAGAPGGPFFSYDPASPASSLAVAVVSSDLVAASALPGGVVHGGTAARLGELASAETAYQQVVNTFGANVASGRRIAASQQMLTQQVDSSREQLAGVSLDEEMLSMVQFQHAYEAAARVMTTVDSMLDTLINRTGLLR